jgi:hypothetical protein
VQAVKLDVWTGPAGAGRGLLQQTFGQHPDRQGSQRLNQHAARSRGPGDSGAEFDEALRPPGAHVLILTERRVDRSFGHLIRRLIGRQRKSERDMESELRRIAAFLNIDIAEDLWPQFAAAGSFEAVYLYRILQLDDDQFFRSRTERRDSVWYGADVKAPARELRDASYHLYDGPETAPVRTENTTRELISFRPGKG